MATFHDDFYDADTNLFNTSENMKVAHILGDEIDNPIYTFRLIESIADKRIQLLNKKFYEVRKNADSQKGDFGSLHKDIDDSFDNSENDLYYRIKNLFGDFEKLNDDLNSQNLLLQKYLTQLTKEKMDLLIQINLCMNRLDNIEKYLGINIAAKRMKKNLTKK
jgi:hypothetical protein